MKKLKSKKMTKSTFAIIIMAIAMVAMLAFGGTYAYFTATGTTLATDGVTTGTIKIATGGSFVAKNTVVMPTQSLLAEDSTVTVTPTTTGDTGEYIAVMITVAFKDADGETIELAEGDTLESIIAITMPEDTWVKDTTTGAYVYSTDGSKASIAVSGTPVTIASAIAFNASDDWSEANAESSTKGYMGATIEVSIQARGIQTIGNESKSLAQIADELF